MFKKKLTDKQLYIGAFAVIAVGGYMVYKFMSKKPVTEFDNSEDVNADTNLNTNSSVKNTTPTTNVVTGIASYPLKLGSKGTNVATLQKWLNDKGYANPKLTADGVFGAKTLAALQAMQTTPYEKEIDDYISKNTINGKVTIGSVSREFYEAFVTKSNPIKNAVSSVLGIFGF
jgi:lysozyme family protein